MIYFVTSRQELYKDYNFEEHEIELTNDPSEFILWAAPNSIMNLDTETNRVEDGPMQHDERSLYVVQLGTIDGEEQYVFDMIDLDEYWLEALTEILLSDMAFICHSARFEYLVIRTNLGIILENLHDTLLMSRILNTGYKLPSGYHSLAGCLKRFFNIELSKEAQTTFTGEPLTIKQINYAALDVIFLYDLYIKLKELLEVWNLWYLYDTIERHALKVYADMELSPMNFDSKYWKELSKDFIRESKNLTITLNDTVAEDLKLIAHLKISKRVVGVDLIQLKDEYKMNWASTVFKKKAFEILAPSLPEEVKTKPKIKQYLKEEDSIPMWERENLDQYMSRDYGALNKKLISKHHDFLEEEKFYVEKDTLLINWASPVHKLYIFQYYYPSLEDSNAKSLVRITKNKLINTFKRWAEANKRVTSYGEGFLTKYVRADGRIAPFNLNQVLNTGRISFGILLQMPAEAKFRNAFLPPQSSWEFIDTDYSSMEVLIAAVAAHEENFLKAIKEGKDLHSMSASMMFYDEWKEMAEEDCEHLKTGKRCKCSTHDKFRNSSKTVTFGLFYGIGPVGLADRLGIGRTEAQVLIDKFFKAFPKFNVYFESNSLYAMENKYIRGIKPSNRVRFFHPPDQPGDLPAIGRAAKNFPIQEANASILKLALIKLREKIIEESLEMVIHLPIHDEILSSCHKDVKDRAIELQEEVMIDAAEEFLTKGLVTVDTNVLSRWTK